MSSAPLLRLALELDHLHGRPYLDHPSLIERRVVLAARERERVR